MNNILDSQWSIDTALLPEIEFFDTYVCIQICSSTPGSKRYTDQKLKDYAWLVFINAGFSAWSNHMELRIFLSLWE